MIELIDPVAIFAVILAAAGLGAVAMLALVGRRPS